MGAMGSGTTLLRLVLDSHESIAIPPETGFMRAYDAHTYTPFKASGKGWTKRLGWKDAERDELLDEVWSDVPPDLRPAAGLTLEAHLEKLREEGRLPEG
jgi:hypothetical protein